MRGSLRRRAWLNAAAIASLVLGVALGSAPAVAFAIAPTPAPLPIVMPRSMLNGLLGLEPVGAGADAAKAKLPPDLVAIEQKMRTLRINSERGSLEEILTGVSPGGEGILESVSSKPSRGRGKRRGDGAKRPTTVIPTRSKQSIPFFTADFETSISPRLAVVRGEILGTTPFQERVIGEQSYLRSPLLAQTDGNRPWLYVSPAELAEQEKAKKEAESDSPSTSVVPGPESTEAGFGKMIELLAHARSVIEVGPREVDGQQTTEFEAELYREQLTGRSKAKGSKAVKRASGPSKLKLDLYLSPEGLPVRTRLQTMLGKVGLSVIADILATEVPVSVQPPPAGEIITAPELKQLEEKEAGPALTHPSKRERRQARRFNACMQRHLPKGARHLSKRKLNKIWGECERIARHPKSKQ